MTDIIIFVIVAVAVGFGLYSMLKQSKKKGGCCSSSDYKLKKKKLTNVKYQKVFHVEGMHCSHCKDRVEEEVNHLLHVAGTVDLKSGELIVSYAEDVDDEVIKSRLERVGYTVTGIEKK